MADLEIIRKEIEKLEKLNNKKNHDEIVTQLQKINECFLRNVIIKINRLEIYPVEVEIYYYKEGVFGDGNCHKNELQKNNFGKLYFHRASRSKSKDSLIDTNKYGGVDVCLSISNKKSKEDDYFLSVLLRSAYIKNRKGTEFITGIHIVVNRITDELENLLEEGKINIEYNIYEDENDKKTFLGGKIDNFKFECKNRKRIQDKNFFEHEKIEKKNYDNYKLNTYIDNEKITSKIVKPIIL